MRSSQYHAMLRTRTIQITEACRRNPSFRARSERHGGSPFWRSSGRRYSTGDASRISISNIRHPRLVIRKPGMETRR